MFAHSRLNRKVGQVILHFPILVGVLAQDLLGIDEYQVVVGLGNLSVLITLVVEQMLLLFVVILGKQAVIVIESYVIMLAIVV